MHGDNENRSGTAASVGNNGTNSASSADSLTLNSFSVVTPPPSPPVTASQGLPASVQYIPSINKRNESEILDATFTLGAKEADLPYQAKEGPLADLIPLQHPLPVKKQPRTTVCEVFEVLETPDSTRAPSPVRDDLTPSGQRTPSTELDAVVGHAYPTVGKIASWRGVLILTCLSGAQLMDNVFMTGVNIALPAIQKDFDVPSSDLQWLISAYTLTFGGFLLLAGVIADRYGRRLVFCSGMAVLCVWTLADGLATSFIQLAVFRALQGIGAAMTVPSAVGLISNYFVGTERTLALTIFGGAGGVGFCVGLVLGGFLTSSLGWRYLFYVSVAIIAVLGILGWIVLPKDRTEGQARSRLDFAGALLSTTGLILLSFVFANGGEYGWGKPLIIVLLILSIACIALFTYVEKKVSDPIMPLSLWKLQNFTILWIAGFVAYGGYQSTIYYITLMAQEINHLTAGETAIRMLPMGAIGLALCLFMSHLLRFFNTKYLLVIGMAICAIAPMSSALMEFGEPNFWRYVFPTTITCVLGIATVYCTITVILLSSVPVNVQSLCGGMINTAFQIGSGVGLALANAVVDATETSKGASPVQQYATGLWCCVGFAGIGMLACIFGLKNVTRPF